MSFHPTKANPCVMMTEHLKTKCCEYIALYVNDLYIATQKPEDIVDTLKSKCKLKIKRNVKLSYDPGWTMNCQLEKYIVKSYMKSSLNFSKTTLLEI